MVFLVKDFMTRKREIVSSNDSVISAIELMVENDVGSVVVVDDDHVVGVFTERDLLRRYLQSQSKLLYMTVAEVMSSPAITIRPNDKLSDAFRIMAEKNVRHLPVVDDEGKLVGYLTWKDMFRFVSQRIISGELQ
ncbi:MAG: CBS domain-containing protein [Methanomassiliicoccales archaeon]|jgi:CBS domain-containing protein|nr:CBS domain-containing protein [Methanomassiliicoccales archaeon]